MNAAFVPVIDLAGFRNGGPDEKKAVAAAVAAACETSGFLVVTGHGVDGDVIDAMYSATRRFFDLPEETKALVAAGPGRVGGFRPAGSSSLAKSRSDTDAPPDICEFFSMNRFSDDHDPNQWPDEPSDMGVAWRTYYRALEELAATLMRVFAIALGLDERWFDDKIDAHCTAMFANHYPAQDVAPPPGRLRLGEHTDFGSLTIVYQDDAAGGLQVFDPEGGWRDVPFVPGGFVVNIGDLMARWTNDRWVSTLHRVVNPPQPGTDRISIPFFHQPNEDAVIECIPTCVPREGSTYPPVTSGEWRRQKIEKSRY